MLIVFSALSVLALSSVGGGHPTELTTEVRNISAVRAFFTNPIVNDLTEFPYFRRKFDVPYLDVTTALTYAREIARASAFHPLFFNRLRVEDLILDRILRAFLTSSEEHCTTAEASASRIGDILTDVCTDRGLLTNRTSETAMRLYAGYFSGTVLMRLSKLPDPKPTIFIRNNSWSVVPRLIRLLSAGLKNSTYVTTFYDGELDSRKSKVLSSALCGSVYSGYNLTMVDHLSQAMVKNYRSSKAVLSGRLREESRLLLVPAVIAESVVSSLVHQMVKVAGKVDEVFSDVLKLIKLGITMDRMNLGASKSDVKYSFD